MNAVPPASKPPMTSMPPTAEARPAVTAATPAQAAYEALAADREIARAALAKIATTVLEGPEDERSVIVADARAALVSMMGPAELDAARQPQPAPGLQPVDSVYLYHWRFDRGEEFGLYRHKADADAAVAARTAEHPGEGLFEVLGMAVLDRPQPQAAVAAQQPQARPGYVTVNARDIAIALNGYSGFTGDPVSVASELHERLRRTVFADAAQQPQPAPELATVDLHRWYAVINQPDGTSKVIGHTDNGLGYYDSVDEWEAKNS